MYWLASHDCMVTYIIDLWLHFYTGRLRHILLLLTLITFCISMNLRMARVLPSYEMMMCRSTIYVSFNITMLHLCRGPTGYVYRQTYTLTLAELVREFDSYKSVIIRGWRNLWNRDLNRGGCALPPPFPNSSPQLPQAVVVSSWLHHFL